MDYKEALNLVNDCVELNILMEREGNIYTVRRFGEGFESKESVVNGLMTDLNGQEVLQEALIKAKEKRKGEINMEKEERDLIKSQIEYIRKDSLRVSKLISKGESISKYELDAINADLFGLADEYPNIFKETVKEEIEELRREIIKNDKLYEKSQPVITDSEYDELYLRLEKLEKIYPEFYDENSPTQKITTTIVEGLEKVKHREPMLSQQKITTEEGVIDFISKSDSDILVQQKLDGVTLVLGFNNGRMIEAVTRGDGEIGENLFHNAKHFTNIPRVISFKGQLEIRTEAVLPYADFERINVDGKYSNPRNLVSGSLRQLDSSRLVGMGFKAIAFDLVHAEGKEFTTDTEKLRFMEELGFEVVDSTLFSSTSEEAIIDYINNYEDNVRKILPHMIDGLVLKYDSIADRESLGHTSKHPRWACAYKFKSMDATTKLIGITDQVGKTGQITPVAELETVNIDGVNISRATLHNYANVRDKDIRINDTVVVARANDVIPQIVQSVKDLRDDTELVKSPPTECPICGSITEFEGANLYCTGINCTPQLEGKIKHFISRDAMNIDGMGEKSVEEFYNAGIIKSIVDIYNLKDKKSEIIRLEGFGEKKFDRLVKGIEESKNRELHNFIYGLSIKNIGRSASKDLANEFRSMRAIIELSRDTERFREKLLTVGTFGAVMTMNIIDFLKNEENIETIEELISFGLNSEIEEISTEDMVEKSLEGKVFVVTGEVLQFKNRKELQAKIEELGGKVTGSVSKNTDYLINNDAESSSSKNKKAKELNIPILSEDDFLGLIN